MYKHFQSVIHSVVASIYVNGEKLNMWPSKTPLWTTDELKLLATSSLAPVEYISLNNLIERSENFNQIINFPISTIKCEELRQKVPEEILQRNIDSVYPVLHEYSLLLYARFLLFKRKYGSNKEKELYKNMTMEQFVDRLLKCRAVIFVGIFDAYKLADGSSSMLSDWSTVGTDKEHDLSILKCLSYDEIKMSALLSVSSYTHFINDGNRSNRGIYETDRSKIEEEGIIMGVIGPRCPKQGVMEQQEIIVAKEQNTKENGYSSSKHSMPNLMLSFYEEPCSAYKKLKKEFSNEQKYVKLPNNWYFNNDAYAKRLALSIDTILIEANDRAKLKNTFAYVHVVGIGLGVWKISPHQDEYFMKVFGDRLRCLGKQLHNISDTCFAYIKSSKLGEYENGDLLPIEDHPLHGIKIHIENREPHKKLSGESKEKLLVVTFAWDGNSLPGNEFWWGQLTSSSDPAAACSTQVAELHNAHINPGLCACNLRIATLDKGLVKFNDYQKQIKMK